MIKNDAFLDALIDLGEETEFSSSSEVEANNMVVSTKGLAINFLSSSNLPGRVIEEPRCGSE